MNESLGTIFIFINLMWIFLGFILRDKNAELKMEDYYTFIFGDMIAISIANYAFGTFFDFAVLDAFYVGIALVISIIGTILLDKTYKNNSKLRNNTGYHNGKATFPGKLHLIYVFYQLMITTFMVIYFVDVRTISYVFIIGAGLYLLSVALDVYKGVLLIEEYH